MSARLHLKNSRGSVSGAMAAVVVLVMTGCSPNSQNEADERENANSAAPVQSERNRLLADLSSDGETVSPADALQFSSSLQTQYAMIERELGGRPVDRGQPSPAETMKFVKNLPSTFEDVAGKLDAASDRRDQTNQFVGIDRVTEDRSIKWRAGSPDEVLAMAANSRNQFASVNRALGVSTQNKLADTSFWPDIRSIDLSSLSPAEKKRIVTASLAETESAFKKLLPVTDATGAILFAIEASGTTLKSSYRIDVNQTGSDASNLRRELTRRTCARAGKDMTMRLGGRYEYVLHAADGHIIDQFTISGSSCS